MKKISLAFVDDHQIVIDGLQSLLRDEPRFHFAFATNDPAQVLPRLQSAPVDILLTDVMMPKIPGNVLARTVRRQFPAIKILALSMSGEGALVNEMVEDSGISGYVLKNISREELVRALETIAGGGTYFAEEVLTEMRRAANRQRENKAAHLTDREVEIVMLIEREFSNRQIAEQLFISERTVETHRKNILRKTATSSVLGLIKYAYEHGLIR